MRRRRRNRRPRYADRSPLLAVLFVVATATTGFITTSVLTASSSVPVSYAVKNTRAIGANDLKPPECAALALSVLVNGSGTIKGPGTNDLILASSGNDIITEKAGNNCIVGGAGTDSVTATGSNSTCIISSTSTETGCTIVVRRP